jgi:molecular chaperone DnaJ
MAAQQATSARKVRQIQPLFERDRDELHCNVPELGGRPGADRLRDAANKGFAPEGRNPAATACGKGIKGIAHYPGDLYCHIPRSAPKRRPRLLEDSTNRLKDAPSGESWTDRLKSFFS